MNRPRSLAYFKKSEITEQDEPLLDGHIYFLENYKAVSTTENLVSDLKWSTKSIDREHLKVFLKQLCLQCAAEAINDGATKINWNFSYPLAFSTRDKGHFEQILERMLDQTCESATGVTQMVTIPAQSESVVTAKFFATTLQNKFAAGGFASGAVCIDIGGETSDISIWQNNELYWQTSLRFAGRHIFLESDQRKPRFSEKFWCG